MVQLRIFVSFRKEIRRLSYEEKGQLLDAMLAYAEDKTLLPLTGKADVLWDVIQERIDAQHASYEDKCHNMEKAREQNPCNNKLISANKDQLSANKELISAEDNLSLHNFEVQEQVQVQVQEQDKSSNKREIKRFAPPSVQDVTDYCLERGSSVDPERFVNFYASKGWKVGNTPMKDWKAAVRNWEQRDKAEGKKANQNYEQRRIRNEDLNYLDLDADEDELLKDFKTPKSIREVFA